MINVFEEAAVREASKRGLDGVICGHIHQPALRKIKGLLYCNDGDWIENCTLLGETYDGNLELLQWTEHQTLLQSMNGYGGPVTADVLPLRRVS